MRKLVALLIITSLINPAFSQDYKTGNLELDASLTIINTDARSDMGGFRSQMKVEYKVSDSKLDYMSIRLGMRPADIYFALEIGKYSKKPIDEVLVIYQRDKGRGWGEIAKNCGIKPGSPAFHAMKSNAGNKAKKAKGPNQKGNGNHKKPDSKDKLKGNKSGGKTSMPDYKTGSQKSTGTSGNKTRTNTTKSKSTKTNPDYRK